MAGGEEGGSVWGGYNYTGGRGTPSVWQPATSCPEDVFDSVSPDLRVPQLPWRVQEDWGCEQTPTEVDVFVLETKSLRAAITPQWGGKVWSLFHKTLGRQLFFNNPAHQPANIGYRKAWSSGGAEWNWSPGKIGHSVFSEAPVWTAVLPSRLGPVVRVWEYDRLNSSVWQVDVLLAGDALFAHPKVTNTASRPLDGYWWTCVAMPVDPSGITRVLTPANLAVSNDGACAPWPVGLLRAANDSFRGVDLHECRAAAGGHGACAWQPDLSYLGNIPQANDFFFHMPQNVRALCGLLRACCTFPARVPHLTCARAALPCARAAPHLRACCPASADAVDRARPRGRPVRRALAPVVAQRHQAVPVGL